jgi:hypothetical protein
MNPWFLFAALLAAAGSWFGGHHQGYKAGVDAQAVADQKTLAAANERTQGIIDGYNVQIQEQQAVASQKARKQRDEVIALQHEREVLKQKLGEQHVKNQDVTNRLRDAYAAYGLRFRAEQGAVGGCSAGSGEGAGAGSTGNAAAAFVQLPEAIARDLRQLVYDADQLNDDYGLCYGYVYPVGSPGS